MDQQAAAAPMASSALELRDRLASGALDAESLVKACLESIAADSDAGSVWAWLDGEHALAAARARDQERRRGRAVGALHGLPIGIKDIIDTARIPTANGTALDAGRVPREDAAVVARLRSAGAIVLGKTVTTELAFMHPAATDNPAAPGHTPGGSSSGSAAAVAAGMVPLAIGTQTGGSVIRPASFCGVVGYKPSFGAVSRSGVLVQSPSLDTVGFFATCVEDVALLAEPLFGHDPRDRATRATAPPRLLDTTLADVPVTPRFGFVRTPWWEQASDDMRGALEELAEHLGDACIEAPLPDIFAEAAPMRRRVNIAEMAKHFAPYCRRGRDQLSSETLEAIDEGLAVSARDYLDALDWPAVLTAGLDTIFENCDALITPAATGAAPHGHASTGDPIFNGLWTFCGMPCVTLPLLESSDGLPMGVQLVGPKGDDARLLRTARWLASLLEQPDDAPLRGS